MIKENFYFAIIGISLAITQVLCITIYVLLIKRERSSNLPGMFQTMICSNRSATKGILNMRSILNQPITASGPTSYRS